MSDIDAIIVAIVNGENLPSADVNEDGEVGISDVNAVIEIILQ